MYPFNWFGTKFINVRFKCPYCQEEVDSGYLDVHAPDFAAENPKDSYVNEDHEVICDNCEESYWITMHVGKDDAFIEMENENEFVNVRIDETSDEEFEYQLKQFEAISDNTHLFQTFKSGIEKLKKLNTVKLDDKELDSILKFQIYTGIISVMETFLSDAFINLTFADEKLFRRFVRSYPEFKQRKFELKEIFEQYENLEEVVKTVLLDIIYHDLRKVREMYRNTFEIEFPDLEKPIQYVLVRHDIVHRNGKTKDGKSLSITTQDVSTAIVEIENFITDIAKRLDLV
jgi:hypothetical protein